MRSLSRLWSGWTFGVTVVLLLAGGVTWAVISDSHGDDRFRRGCTSQGGHLHKIYADKLCLSPDGRVLEP